MKRITSVILLCAAMLVAKAQSRHVFGRVVDFANDEPLIGVSIMPIGDGTERLPIWMVTSLLIYRRLYRRSRFRM